MYTLLSSSKKEEKEIPILEESKSKNKTYKVQLEKRSGFLALFRNITNAQEALEASLQTNLFFAKES